MSTVIICERVIKASAQVFWHRPSVSLLLRFYPRFTNLLRLEQSALYCSSTNQQDQLLGVRRFRYSLPPAKCELTDLESFESIPEHVREGLKSDESRESQYYENYYIGCCFRTRQRSLLYVTYHREPSALDKQLLEIYATNVAITYEIC